MSAAIHKFYVIAIYFGLLVVLLTEMEVAALRFRGREHNGKAVVKPKIDMECRYDFINENTRGPTGQAPNGTPMYTVTITNTCPSNCRITNLHLKCESFTSEVPIPPNIFRTVTPNDCLVNDGQPIGIGNVVTFEYSHPQIFDLPVLSLECLS